MILSELQFENDSEAYDKSVSRFSLEIAQLNTHSKEYNWRYELKIGDQVDVLSTAVLWYASTILELKEDLNSNNRL